MSISSTLQLIYTIAEARSAKARKEAAQQLARRLGAEDLLIFLRGLDDRSLVPAAGFGARYPGGVEWDCLLAKCDRAGQRLGEVPFPGHDDMVDVFAFTVEDGTTYACLGATPHLGREIEGALALLSSSLKSQRELALERASAEAADPSDSTGRDRVIATLAKELRDPLMRIEHCLDGLDDLLPAHRLIRDEVARAKRIVDELASAAGRRVLIVEDNPDAAREIAEWVERRGFRVAIASDGHSALRLYDEFHPETAILDIGLPNLDGYEVARRLRARPDGANVQLIALTGLGDVRDRTAAFAAGFDEHLTKPVTTAALLSLLLGHAGEALPA